MKITQKIKDAFSDVVALSREVYRLENERTAAKDRLVELCAESVTLTRGTDNVTVVIHPEQEGTERGYAYTTTDELPRVSLD